MRAVGIRQGVEHINMGLIDLVKAHPGCHSRRYQKGDRLHWQGDLATCAFAVRRGRVKLYSQSAEGGVCMYDIIGPGRLVGITGLLLEDEHEATAEAMEDTEVLVIPHAPFTQMLATEPLFSMAVMEELARTARFLARLVQELGCLDVRHRLERCLTRLADQYGIDSKEGTRIELEITHEELAELIASNRCSVTSYLNRFKQEGLLSVEDRRFILVPREQAEIFKSLKRAVIECDAEGAISWARRIVEEQADPFRALNAMSAAMKQVDEDFVREKSALPDVIGAAFAMQSAMPILADEIGRIGESSSALGTVVIGTVQGDIHDIGKTMVAMLLTASGFRVIDLGVDVRAGGFIEAVRQHRPEVLAMSALMTTTAPEQLKVVRALEEAGLRDKVKIAIGGGAVTQELAQQIGADGYESTARCGVELVKRLLADKTLDRQRTLHGAD